MLFQCGKLKWFLFISEKHKHGSLPKDLEYCLNFNVSVFSGSTDFTLGDGIIHMQ